MAAQQTQAPTEELSTTEQILDFLRDAAEQIGEIGMQVFEYTVRYVWAMALARLLVLGIALPVGLVMIHRRVWPIIRARYLAEDPEDTTNDNNDDEPQGPAPMIGQRHPGRRSPQYPGYDSYRTLQEREREQQTAYEMYWTAVFVVTLFSVYPVMNAWVKNLPVLFVPHVEAVRFLLDLV